MGGGIVAVSQERPYVAFRTTARQTTEIALKGTRLQSLCPAAWVRTPRVCRDWLCPAAWKGRIRLATGVRSKTLRSK